MDLYMIEVLPFSFEQVFGSGQCYFFYFASVYDTHAAAPVFN